MFDDRRNLHTEWGAKGGYSYTETHTMKEKRDVSVAAFRDIRKGEMPTRTPN